MGITWSEFYAKIYNEAREKRELIYTTFELTSRCNFQCKMCYICAPSNEKEVKSRELTAKQWIDLAKEARDTGALYLTLTGGEVFLREDFKEIYEGLMNLGFAIQVFTNGSLITPQIVEWFSKMPPYMVSITLYGTSRETYEAVTGQAGGYDRTVKGIDMLIASGVPVEIKTTPIKANMKEYNEIVDFALQRKAHLGIVNYISPRREGDITDPLGNRLSPQELSVYEKNIIETNRKLRVEKDEVAVVVEDPVSTQILEKEIPKKIKLSRDDAFICGAGKCGNWISWDGTMIPCGSTNNPAAFPLKIGFNAAWKELKKLCSDIPICNECFNCKYRENCDTCPARLYSETGQFDKSAAYLCENAKLRYEEINRKYK